MKQSHLTAPLINTAFALTIFVGLAATAFIYAWRRRHLKGHSQILGRRALWLLGAWLLVTPLSFLAALWIKVPGTPVYVQNSHTQTLLIHTLGWVTIGLLIFAILGAALVIRKLHVEENERQAMRELKSPEDRPRSLLGTLGPSRPRNT